MTATRTFVPAEFDPSQFEQIEPLFQQLIDRPLDSPEALEQWLSDFSETLAAISEYRSRLNIDYSCHTDDEAAEKAFMHFVENIAPKLQPLHFALQSRYIECEHRTAIETTVRMKQLGNRWQADVDLYRDENVPIFTEITKLTTEYDKLCAAMMVEFDGKPLTLQQLGRYMEEPDRDVRERAWRLTAETRLANREQFDAIYDKQIERRQTVAANADCESFIDYAWRSKHRFDYTPDDCRQYADSVEQLVMPLMEKLTAERKAALGLDVLRPWDTSVDPHNRPALRPFDPENIEQFVANTRTVFDRIDPRLGEQFGQLKFGRNLDLDSRKGKRPGGYQAALEESKEPFIFMNAAGVQRDVETMLHEGGHAFHFLAAAEAEPLVFVRHAPLEFCEVASMSMELLADEHLGVYYADETDAARAVRVHLEGIVKVLTWIATIDQLQHWIYANPTHSREQRTEAWLEVMGRFSSKLIDWTGCEDARAATWQRQLHLYHAPFYYIEYGIAQLGALQVWLNYRQDRKQALGQLLEAFALGGTRPLPELFETAGIRFAFDAGTIGPLVDAIEEELAALPV